MNNGILLMLILGAVVLGVVSYKLYESKTKSNFCLCSGLGKKSCSRPNELRKLYAEGKLTEFTIPHNGTGDSMMPYDAFQSGQKENSHCNMNPLL